MRQQLNQIVIKTFLNDLHFWWQNNTLEIPHFFEKAYNRRKKVYEEKNFVMIMFDQFNPRFELKYFPVGDYFTLWACDDDHDGDIDYNNKYLFKLREWEEKMLPKKLKALIKSVPKGKSKWQVYDPKFFGLVAEKLKKVSH